MGDGEGMRNGWHQAGNWWHFGLGDIEAELHPCWLDREQRRAEDSWEMYSEGAWRFRNQRGIDEAKARTMRWIAKNLKAKVKEINEALSALQDPVKESKT